LVIITTLLIWGLELYVLTNDRQTVWREGKRECVNIIYGQHHAYRGTIRSDDRPHI